MGKKNQKKYFFSGMREYRKRGGVEGSKIVKKKISIKMDYLTRSDAPDATHNFSKKNWGEKGGFWRGNEDIKI